MIKVEEEKIEVNGDKITITTEFLYLFAGLINSGIVDIDKLRDILTKESFWDELEQGLKAR